MVSEASEIARLRQRVARIEKLVVGRDAILIKAMGTALGQGRREVDTQLKALTDRAPLPLPLPTPDALARVGQKAGLPMSYHGTWDACTAYTEGAAVTSSGALWVAKVGSKALRPGDNNGCWQLAVKPDQTLVRRAVKDALASNRNGRST